MKSRDMSAGMIRSRLDKE